MIFINILKQAGVWRGPGGCYFCQQHRENPLHILYCAYSHSQGTKILTSLPDCLGSSPGPLYGLHDGNDPPFAATNTQARISHSQGELAEK